MTEISHTYVAGCAADAMEWGRRARYPVLIIPCYEELPIIVAKTFEQFEATCHSYFYAHLPLLNLLEVELGAYQRAPLMMDKMSVLPEIEAAYYMKRTMEYKE